jgi:hypothetical protein
MELDGEREGAVDDCVRMLDTLLDAREQCDLLWAATPVRRPPHPARVRYWKLRNPNPKLGARAQWEAQARTKVESDVRSEDHTDGVHGLRNTDAEHAPVSCVETLYADAAHAKPVFDSIVRAVADAVGVNPDYVILCPLKVSAHAPPLGISRALSRPAVLGGSRVDLGSGTAQCTRRALEKATRYDGNSGRATHVSCLKDVVRASLILRSAEQVRHALRSSTVVRTLELGYRLRSSATLVHGIDRLARELMARGLRCEGDGPDDGAAHPRAVGARASGGDEPAAALACGAREEPLRAAAAARLPRPAAVAARAVPVRRTPRVRAAGTTPTPWPRVRGRSGLNSGGNKWMRKQPIKSHLRTKPRAELKMLN